MQINDALTKLDTFIVEFIKLPMLTQWAIVILLIAGFIIHLFVYNERSAHDAPSLFTTAGIFFTFVGIAQGLITFDAQNIEKSIPDLLTGLQTAFIASIVGVGLALTVKLRVSIFGYPKRKGKPLASDGANVDDLYKQMVLVRQALIGKDESTLLNQIKLSRQDSNDRLDALKRSQEEMFKTLADNNSKALIEALKDVIRDFNTKISEQFGENFRQLNEAVGGLLSWQDTYRIQMSEMISQQSQTAANMRLAADRYEELVSNAEKYHKITQKVSDLYEALNEQRIQIQESLTALGNLLIGASDGIPKLQNKIMELTEQMTFGVKNNQQTITQTIINSSNEIKIVIADIKRLLIETTTSTNQEFNSHIKSLSEKSSEQIAKLDIALEKELTKALTTLGAQLSSLSRQFVDDYTPLTERLRQVVRLAERER